jgi:hypothetical protein
MTETEQRKLQMRSAGFAAGARCIVWQFSEGTHQVQEQVPHAYIMMQRVSVEEAFAHDIAVVLRCACISIGAHELMSRAVLCSHVLVGPERLCLQACS